jgi:hypothetical protein
MADRKELLWTTKDGRKIAIKDMTTEHIQNTINLLKRNGFISVDTFNLYLSTPGPQGEMAQYYFDQELDEVLSSPTTEYLDLFEEELQRRESNGRI